MTAKKILPLKELRRKIQKLKKQKKKIAFTNGCFDVIHSGHVRGLEKARALADILVVAINTDRSTQRLKGKNRPIFPLKERAKILSAFEFVDFLVSFDELTPLKVIKTLKPDILVKGGDYPEGEIVGSQFVKSCGGKVKRIPIYKNYSSTRIIKEMRKPR